MLEKAGEMSVYESAALPTELRRLSTTYGLFVSHVYPIWAKTHRHVIRVFVAGIAGILRIAFSLAASAGVTQ